MGVSDFGLDNNPNAMLGAVPSSFATQMAMATGALKGLGPRAGREEDTEGMMGRLMLARMKTLEEGFAEVVKEFRGMRTAGNSSVEGNDSLGFGGRGKGKERAGGGKKRRPEGMNRTRSEVDVNTLAKDAEKGKENKPARPAAEGQEMNPEGHIIEHYLTKGSSF